LFSLALGLTMPSYAFFKTANGVDDLGNYANWTKASSVLQHTVSGTVSGPDGVISAATVSVVGTSVKTSSDNNGRYSIDAPIGSTLRFTYVGLTSKDVAVTGNTLSVTLESSSDVLDEVVV